MKAAIYEGGKRVRIGESTPVVPGEGQVRLRVSHCGICGTDLHIFLGDLDRRAVPPRVIGHETSAVIEEVGAGVKGWHAGDAVAVLPVLSCGVCATCRSGNPHVCPKLRVLGVDSTGGMQASWTVPAANLFRLPAGLSPELAALVEPMAVACHDVALARIKPGEKCLVIGGGPIGALCALVAKHDGADVVVSEVNAFRIGLLEAAGLRTVNPRETSVDEFVLDWTGGQGVDLSFEVSGTQPGADLMTSVLRPKGRVVLVSVYGFKPQVDLYRFFARELELIGVRLYGPQDFERAIDLLANGGMPLASMITAVEPIDRLQAVFEDLTSGGAAMKVLIDCQS